MDDTKNIAIAIGITIGLIVAFFAISAIIAVIGPLAIFAAISFVVYTIVDEKDSKRH
jgi:4-amino-4-deoxy-L-arabinose transferase-like glycosyltransferase